jgi:hypothetical protein
MYGSRHLLPRLVLALAGLVATGCSTLDIQSKLPWATNEEKLKKDKFQRPVRMAAIWTPTTMTSPSGSVTRGFGGRLYFYNDVGEPIAVEGQLMVYAYDDSQRTSASHVKSDGGVEDADRKYAFTSDQFSGHFAPSDFGPAYSVWIPWGPENGPQTQVSLIPVFTSSSGAIVMAQAARNVLKGYARDAEKGETTQAAAANPADDGVVRYDTRVKSTELRSTTIELSNTTAERLSRLPPQPAAAANQAPDTTENSAPPETRATTPAFTPVNAAGKGVPGPWMPPLAPPTRFEPPKFQVPAGPNPPPTSDRAPTPLSPSTRPSAPAWPPPPHSSAPAPAASAAVPETAGSGS